MNPVSLPRRLTAIVIDSVVLRLITGFLLRSGFRISLEPQGEITALAVGALYFGLLESRGGLGASVGKRLAGIELRTDAGDVPGPGRTLIRFLAFSLVWYWPAWQFIGNVVYFVLLEGVQTDPGNAVHPFGYVRPVAEFGRELSLDALLIGLSVFPAFAVSEIAKRVGMFFAVAVGASAGLSRLTRGRFPHDILCRTQVVRRIKKTSASARFDGRALLAAIAGPSAFVLALTVIPPRPWKLFYLSVACQYREDGKIEATKMYVLEWLGVFDRELKPCSESQRQWLASRLIPRYAANPVAEALGRRLEGGPAKSPLDEELAAGGSRISAIDRAAKRCAKGSANRESLMKIVVGGYAGDPDGNGWTRAVEAVQTCDGNKSGVRDAVVAHFHDDKPTGKRSPAAIALVPMLAERPDDDELAAALGYELSVWDQQNPLDWEYVFQNIELEIDPSCRNPKIYRELSAFLGREFRCERRCLSWAEKFARTFGLCASRATADVPILTKFGQALAAHRAANTDRPLDSFYVRAIGQVVGTLDAIGTPDARASAGSLRAKLGK